MKSQFFALAFACALPFGFSAAAHAQNVPPNGTVTSASTSLPGSNIATVFATPTTGHFILTQLCGSAGSNFELTAGSLGFIAAIDASIQTCTPFSPGYAIPKFTAIECKNRSSVPANCSISGILSP